MADREPPAPSAEEALVAELEAALAAARAQYLRLREALEQLS